MKIVKFIGYISLLFLLIGCTGIERDFVGNTAGTIESWDKNNVAKDEKLQDLDFCMRSAIKIYPLGNVNLDKKRTAHHDYCMLKKGYKYYPRGIDGKSASSCLQGSKDRPACRSVPLGGNLKF